jgi:RNA polymerase sigma factor (sigma-70 family)
MEVLSLPRPGGRIVARSPRLLASLADERLVDEVRQGNEAAFEVIYDRHHRGILSFCRHMLASREEAEDAVQQAFVSAYRDLVSNDRPIKLKAWLYTIARNRCLSMLRARHEQPAELDDVPTVGLAEEVQHRDELRRLLADVRDLPDDQRAALVLSELGDLSHSEIAEIVGCETLKVKSLVFQARSSLAESRDARDIPCREIREQLSTLHGGALRRGPLRRHLRACPGCAAFREEVRRQRAMLAIVLPVVPSAALKHGVFAALGMGPGAGVAAGGLAAGGAVATTNGAAGAALTGSTAAGAGGLGAGGVVSAIGASGAAKLAVAVVVAGVAVGGGVAVRQVVNADKPSGTSARGHSGDAGTARGSMRSSAGAAGAGANPNGRAANAHGKSSSAAVHAKGHGASHGHGHGHGATGHHGKSAEAKSGSSAAQGQSQTSSGSTSSHHKGGSAKPHTTGQHPQHPVHPTTPSGSGLTHTTEHPPPPPKKPPHEHIQASDGSTTP